MNILFTQHDHEFIFDYPYRVLLRNVFNTYYYIPFEYDYKTFIKLSEKYPIETFKLARHRGKVNYIVTYNILLNKWSAKLGNVSVNMSGIETHLYKFRNLLFTLF